MLHARLKRILNKL